MSENIQKQDNSFEFSIIIAMDNVEDYIESAINSIVKQDFDFNKVQIILIDQESTDSSKDIALKFKNKYSNIILLSNENTEIKELVDLNPNFTLKNKADSYNLALRYVRGKYVNFMNSFDGLSKNVLKEVYNFFLKYEKEDFDLVDIPVRHIDNKNKEYFLDFKYDDSYNELKKPIVDLVGNPEYIQVNAFSSFIKREAINFEFDSKTKMSDALFINKILLNKRKYGLVKKAYYLYREDSDISFENLNKDEIINAFKYFFKDLIDYSYSIDGYIPLFIQFLFVYYLKFIVEISSIEDVFQNQDERNEFWNYLDDILSYIDLGSIKYNKTVTSSIKSFLIYIKNKDFHVDIRDKKVFLSSNAHIINDLTNSMIIFDIVDFKGGFLNLSAFIKTNSPKESLVIEAIKDSNGIKETFEVKNVEYLNTDRETVNYLSIPWLFTYSFDLKIPIDNKILSKISFNLIFKEKDITVPLEGNIGFKYYANISRYSPYFVKDNMVIVLNAHTFYIMPYSFIKTIKYEVTAIVNLLTKKPDFFKKALLFRLMHFVLYPIMKNKKIWLFMDRQKLTGDNGEHFFKYAVNVKDDVSKYFVVMEGTDDYNRLKRIYGNKVVAFDSFKHKFLYLFADKLLQSQTSPKTYNPFRYMNQRLYAGLSKAKPYFLQHGVARYDMSSWVTKFDKNLYLILTVSDLDYQEFTSDNYNFDNDIVQTLGFPRYDNLTNKNLKKQIVIMPTWRNYIKNSNQLIHSEYYSRFNNLLNNEKLINHAKEKGYEIILKPHPLMYKFINVFNVNEYVKVDNVTKHHDILCDSALMITDYSSVAFDFVYLKKPVIYYQYEGGEDHHFDISTVLADDKSMEFGEIIKDEDVLIDKIVEYMDKNCEMEDIYKERVNKFFKYNDKNNSKRVYDWVYKN